ncbi:MAG: hypothetical protein AAGI23_12235 [Bacteroidota bacterium]
MTKQINFSLLLLLCSTLLLQSCLQDECDASQTFIRLDPIYKSAEDIRQPIGYEAARSLRDPGKIYYYNQFMFINERQEGIHVIDNSNPEQPENIAFIKIDGNVDMAVRGTTLYADSYMDLLVVNISDLTNPVIEERQEDVFINNFPLDERRGYIVGYDETSVTERIDCSDPNFGQPNFWRGGAFFANAETVDFATNDANGTRGNAQASGGIGGSFARFAIYQDFLYVIDNSQMTVFDIRQERSIKNLNVVPVGWQIETIFPYEDKLFIGASHGMYIFDNANPIEPEYASLFTHARACDPVVVEGTTAYVTLRDGTFCEGFSNQLDVVDISNIYNPRLIASHDMDNPHGLSVRDKIVYLCDGESGLRVLDLNSPKNAKELDRKKFRIYDAIALPSNDLVMVIGEDGFYQFDAENPKNLKQLSVIPVER